MDIFDLFALYLSDTSFEQTICFIIMILIGVFFIYLGNTEKSIIMTSLGILVIGAFLTILALITHADNKILSTRDFH